MVTDYTTSYECACLDNFIASHTVVSSMDDRCSICFQGISDESVVTLRCRHYFHSECSKEWIARCNSCPLCRDIVTITCTCIDDSEPFVPEAVLSDMLTNTSTLLYSIDYVTNVARYQELSDSLRRLAMQVVPRSTARAEMVHVFSTWQALDSEFIQDYAAELDLAEIHARADELELPQWLVDDIGQGF